jgi:hypothetical protein
MINRKSNIFILGAGKTGTTFLYYTIINSLGSIEKDMYNFMFEPKTFEDISMKYKEPMLVKMLMERYVLNEESSLMNHFDKKIAIIRDPRDTIISRMLYQVYDFYEENRREDMLKIKEVLLEKEQNPSSISVIEIYNEIRKIFGKGMTCENAIKASLLTIKNNSLNDFFMFKYENMIDNNWESLSKYLGFLIYPSEVKKKHNRVRRSATYGDWKRWFTNEDVRYFKPRLNVALEKAGYGQDWIIDNKEEIDPNNSSQYVEKLFNYKFGNV